MMSRRRRHHQHKSPSKSNRSSTNQRLHHTSATAEEEPIMTISSHRDDDDDDDDRMRPVVHLQPNLIARLIGIDAAVPTPPPKPAACTVQAQVQAQRQRHTKGGRPPYYYSYINADADPGSSSSSSRLCLNRMMMVMGNGRGWRPRLRRRRHPQEEELLQKMRQDLRAWQASKAAPALLQTETSSCGGPSSAYYSHAGGGRSSSLVLQAIAQQDLRRQKMARYGLAFRLGHTTKPKVTLHDDLLPLIKNKNKNKNGSVVSQGECDPSSEPEHDHENAAAEPQPAATAMPHVIISPSITSPRAAQAAAAAAPAARAQELPSHRHTPIVLLKPTTSTCSESDTATGGVAIGGGQNTKTVLIGGLPKLHRDAGMSVLLQEVKDRVQRELTLLTAATTKTPVSAWAIPPPLQQQVTKEDRHGNKRLFRSESFRAFRRDRRRNASPEAYIPNTETAVSPEKVDDEESVTDAPFPSVLRPGVGVGVGVSDGQSFRSECLTTKHRDDAAASPRLLFRSLSAPEPGFSFSSLGSRLFGDAIASSARSTKRGASEPAAAAAAAGVTSTTKNVVSAGFSSLIRGTVSSLRHSFSSRRNPLFRRKTHWSNKASLAEIHPAKMEVPVCTGTATSPSHETFSLFKVAQANLSELPPSPVSPLEVATGHSCRHFFTDLHFTLPPAEVSPNCVSEMEPPVGTSESSSFRTDISAVEAAACSRDKAYITELLIAAGLYYHGGDGSSSESDNKASACRVDSMARPMPICDDVFEDVEDMYYYRGDYIVAGGGMCDGTDHRMLFDLANEALQRPASSSSLRQWVVDSTGMALGKKLVDDVWQQVQALRNNPQAQEMQTIDEIVAYEVRRSMWTEVLLYEDVYVVGRKIERAIFDELIQDFLACATTWPHVVCDADADRATTWPHVCV